MNKDEAWKVIEKCKNWNPGQKSISYAFDGVRTAHDDLLDARRKALEMAWKVVQKDDE